jgi:hypothetical protein
MAVGDILYDIKKTSATHGKKAASVLRRLRPFIIGALVILILVPLVTILVINVIRSGEENDAAPASLFSNIRISREELSLGDEPDFLPEIIPLQEQRKTWTAEDADRYWTDPASIGEARIKEKITATVDAILENIP